MRKEEEAGGPIKVVADGRQRRRRRMAKRVKLKSLNLLLFLLKIKYYKMMDTISCHFGTVSKHSFK
jgi:hypothetical protein